jgi:WD40 repeat protein
VSDAILCDEWLERLHAALHRGERPVLTGALPPDAARLPVLLELVHAEIDYRLKRRELCRVEEYLQRYPALRDDHDGVMGLILAEARFRACFEPALSCAEYYERFEDHRAALQARLSAALGSTSCFPQVPGFEILGELGRGGMGVVYMARQRALDRLVALKVVLDGGALGSEEASRLRVEAQAIAGLEHPNVVKLYEVGVHAGCSYLALEYVAGVDLEAYAAGRPMPPREAAALVEMLARAVEHAHRHGIIHRDLKPANILLKGARRPAPGPQRTEHTTPLVPLIADFGLARLRDGSGLTHTGQMLGTPGYMAPEQVTGSAGALGPGVDIYALGAILYALIGGASPFAAKTPQETLRLQARGEPVELRRLRRTTPRDLDVICQTCLAHDRHRRYASAQDVAEELRRFLAGEPIVARPAGPLERTVKWARRKPLLAAASVIALAALAAAIGGLFWHDVRLQQAVDQKEEELARRQQQLDEERETAARQTAERDRWNAYAADMRVGLRLLQSGDVHALHGLLQRHAPTPADPVDRRGFEWWHLARMANEAKPPWRAHDGSIGLVAYADNGKALVTAAAVPPFHATQVKVWDLAMGKARVQLDCAPNAAPPWCVAAVAPDGRAIALPYQDFAHADIFDLTGRRIGGAYCKSRVYGLALTADGRSMAVVVPEGVQVRNGDAPAEFPLQASIQAKALKLAPAMLSGAPLVAVASGPDTVQAWNYASKRLSWRIRCAQAPTALAVLPRRSWLAIAQGSAPILVCNGTGGGVARLLPPGAVQALAVSSDERLLAAATEDGSVRLWDIATWRLLGTWRWKSIAIHALAFAPNARELAVGTADGVVHRLEVREPLTPMILAPAPRLDGPVAYSTDGRTLAVGASDGAVAILDAASGRTLRILRGDGEPLRALMCAPSNDTVAAVSEDSGMVRLWDARTGRRLHELWEPPGRAVRCVAFTADGKVLATAGTGAEIVAWDVASGQRLTAWQVGTAGVQALAFAPKGYFLACSSATGELRLWDADPDRAPRARTVGAAAPPRAPHQVGGEVHELAWSPDGKTLAIGTDQGVVRYDVSDPAQPQRLASIWAHGGGSIQYTADGKTLLADSHHTALFDTKSGQAAERVHLEHHAVALAPSGKQLALVSRPRGGLWLIDRAGHRMRSGGGLLPGAVRSLALTPDGRLLAVGRQLNAPIVACHLATTVAGFPLKAICAGQFPSSAGDGIALWDCAAGTPQRAFPDAATLAPPDRVAIDPAGRFLAAGSADGSVWIWDLTTRQQPKRRFIHAGAELFARGFELSTGVVPGTPKYPESIADLAFAPDGATLAILSTLGQLCLWDSTTWQEQQRVRVGDIAQGWLRYSPNGRILAVGGGQIVLYDPATGETLGTMGAPDDPSSLCGAFAPDGKTLVTGSEDRHLRIWDLAARRERARLGGHLDRVSGVAFAPDGRTLASCSWDRTVQLWHVGTWQEAGTLEGHTSRVHAVAFSHDGQLLVSGDDANVLLWRAATARALAGH